MKINIRTATPEDYPAIASLIKNELGYPLVDEPKLYARLDAMRLSDSHVTAVAVLEDRVIGFVGFFKGMAYNYDDDYIQILAIATLSDLQNKGVGSQLLRWVEDYALDNNAHIIKLTSRLKRTEAHLFYESNGFTRISYGFSKEV